MASEATPAGSPSPPRPRVSSLPKSALGWWAVALTVAIFPVAWTLMTHAIPWPVLDTAVAPVILVTLIDAAAAVGLVATVRRRERSVLTIAAVAIAVPLALFGTLMLIGEALFPH